MHNTSPASSKAAFITAPPSRRHMTILPPENKHNFAAATSMAVSSRSVGHALHSDNT